MNGTITANPKKAHLVHKHSLQVAATHLAFRLRLRVSTLKHHGIYGENMLYTPKEEREIPGC